MKTAYKILIIGPAWIGDMIMAQTLFKLLKQQLPNALIDVLAPPWTLPLLKRMPEVTNSIPLPIKHKELALKKRYQIARKLRKNQYQQAIILPNSFKAALIPFWAKIPLRTGWRGEMRWGLLNDLRILNKTKLPLMIQRFAALALHKNAIPQELPWPSLQVYNCKNDVNKPILAICPGAEYGPSKRWPAEYFAKIATQKIAANWRVWIFGSTKDQPIAAQIQSLTDNNCLDLTGKTSLEEAIDLLAQAKIVITNDTGLMHIAAATNRPLIAIYGSSTPEFTPPLTNSAQIVSLNLECSPCFKRHCPLKHHNCMRKLTPELVHL